ncbi:hypothetical protein AAEX28_00260 [Lentisphaerota bacterium WC36G]|nr:hypothetical protein LJT99_03140 [Lentisphaerae bacterium WC36]
MKDLVKNLLCLAMMSMLINTSCSSLSSETKEQKEIKDSKFEYMKLNDDEKTLKEIDAIRDKIFESFAENNYQLYCDLTLDSKETRATKERFSAMSEGLMKTVGKVKDKKYLGFLQKKFVAVYLWKVRFEMPNQKSDKNKKVDFLVKLSVGKVDNKLKVVGFFID